MITDRERYLMGKAMEAGSYYKDLDQWLDEFLDSCGHTVEQLLSHDADIAAKN